MTKHKKCTISTIPSSTESQYLRFPEHKPEDDQTVLAIHEKHYTLPHKCFWDEETGAFLSLECNDFLPILVTDWMPIPKRPAGK